MLKIKDNVDLKELEKFGFKPKYDEDTGKVCAYQKKCEKDYREFGAYANDRKEIPEEIIFNLMKGLRFPKEFFYNLKWNRVDY